MRRLQREHWRKIDAIFDAALDRPPATRVRFVSEACEGNLDLLEEVLKLLELEEEAERVLGDSAAEFAQPVIAGVRFRIPGMEDLSRNDPADGDPSGGDPSGSHPSPLDRPPLDEPPHEVGPYAILSEIGRGGMGRVYLAHRKDGVYQRNVALKLVRAEVATDEVLQRFRQEQQILANLEHPSIARLYDAGASESGLPYLVMEYVEGSPIDRYCDDRRLTVDERLELFLDVCRAVQFAHQKLVVHRDLKPSNVVVTAAGEVRLLDFGIAKLLDEAPDGRDALQTRTGVHVMTPEYAAPEQILGDQLTTATDVYALGVMLHELLVGRRPFDLRGLPPWKAHSTILDQEPRRPSAVLGEAEDREAVCTARATKPDRLVRRLRGDLDTIILTALQKDPTRRYVTVEALQEDVQRFLSGTPINARRDSALYRTGKFVRRHRWGVAGAGAFVLLLILFGIITAIQLAATRRERDRAAEALAKSEQVMTFMTEIFREADPMVARGDTLNVYQLLERATQRAEEGLIEQPDVHAAVLRTVGTVYLNLAAYGDAEDLLGDALALQREIAPGSREELETLDYLGRVYRERGEHARAVDIHRQVVESRRKLHEPGDPAIAQALSELGLSMHRLGDFDGARAAFEESIAIYREQASASAGLADALANYGVMLFDVGNADQAEPLFREALGIVEAQYGPAHPKVAMVLSSLASTQQHVGKLRTADSLFTRALAIHRAAFGELNPNVSLVLNNLATLYDEEGAHERADSFYRAAIRIDTELLGPDNANVAITRHNLGLMLLDMGRLDEAEAELRQSVAVLRATLSDEHLYTAIISASLGLSVCENGKPIEGQAIVRASLATLREQLPADHWRIAVASRNLGSCLIALSRIDEAVETLTEARAILADELGEDSEGTREADELLERALAARRASS